MRISINLPSSFRNRHLLTVTSSSEVCQGILNLPFISQSPKYLVIHSITKFNYLCSTSTRIQKNDVFQMVYWYFSTYIGCIIISITNFCFSYNVCNHHATVAHSEHISKKTLFRFAFLCLLAPVAQFLVSVNIHIVIYFVV